MKELEVKNLLAPEVGGARPGRATNIETVVHNIQQAMQETKHTAVGLFDLEDAYNKVDVRILANKMLTMGITAKLTRWIMALLDTRRCQMQFGRWKSDIFEVSSGLPQGFPLSSVLFKIYTADIITLKVDKGARPFTLVHVQCCDYVKCVVVKEHRA